MHMCVIYSIAKLGLVAILFAKQSESCYFTYDVSIFMILNALTLKRKYHKIVTDALLNITLSKYKLYLLG